MERAVIRAVLAALLASAPMAAPHTAAAADAPAFIADLGDVPLMPGFVLRDDETVMFDKPDGRIVEAVAEGGASPDAVRQFYDRSLPQLGWVPDATGYRREGEALKLEIEHSAGRTVVRFFLSPAG